MSEHIKIIIQNFFDKKFDLKNNPNSDHNSNPDVNTNQKTKSKFFESDLKNICSEMTPGQFTNNNS